MKYPWLALTCCVGLLGLSTNACQSRDWDDSEDDAHGGGGGADGDGGLGGTGTGGTPNVVGDECVSASECELEDATHCTATCEDVDGTKRCVLAALDEDKDGHGIPECEIAPGDDCDDADPYSYPGAPAVSAIGEVRCVHSVTGTCQIQGASIAWTSVGEALLAYADTSVGTYGAVVAQALDEEGAPTGAVTTWSAPSTAPLSTGAITIARKDNDSAFGLLRGDRDAGGESWWGLEFSEVSFGVNATMTSTELVAEGPYSATGHLDLVRLSSSWNMYGRHAYYTASLVTGNCTTTATLLSAGTGMQGLGRNTRIVGSVRGVIGPNDASYNNSSYDPALVFQRYPTTGSMHTQQGSDVVLIGNNHTTDLAPNYTLGKFGDNFIAFFRDNPTAVPLLGRVLNTTGATVGSEVIYTNSPIVPVDVLDLGDLGGILIGYVLEGTDRFVVAQRFDAELRFVGEPVKLSDALTVNPSIVARGTARKGSVVFAATGDWYRTFAINACE
ncbi:MAG TPA: hypothetical protein VLC09_19165 [Polyangiaceae bacterium]|nr:hypothetical protein [Polyangiaceae bacterium]